MDTKQKEPAKTTVRLDPTLLEDVQVACIRRHVSQAEAFEEGVKLWLMGGDFSARTNDPLSSGLSEENARLLTQIAGILKRNDQRYIPAMRALVTAATLEAIPPRGGESPQITGRRKPAK